MVVGSAAEKAVGALPSAAEIWWAESATGPAGLARALAPLLAGSPLVVLPASPDGRDLAPRLAAEMGRELLAGAVRCSLAAETGGVRADLLRVDGRALVAVESAGPAVVTLMPGTRSPGAPNASPVVHELTVGGDAPTRDPLVVAVLEPDPATMDLADATRVIGGGAGLVPRGASGNTAPAVFSLLTDVAAALGASAGATRVVTDAGWMSYDRQIGTTGVAIDPDLYVALGISGASQHVGGLGSPDHTVSVNTDPSCPMTAMADLGLVADALGVLIALAGRLGVPVPDELSEVARD